MTVLLLVRHGQSEMNINKCFTGQLDVDLSEMGIKQAQMLADWVVENHKIDAIYSSDLLRAYHTAEPTAKKLGLKIKTSDALREIYAGQWQGMSFTQIKEKYPAEHDVWMHDCGNAVCPGGESVQHLADRVIAKIRQIAQENDGKTVMIATHATPIRVFEAVLRKGDISLTQQIPFVPNTSTTVCCYENGIFEFRTVGFDGYLEGCTSSLPSNI